MLTDDKKTLLILIGGAGFIGQHIIERFNTDKTIDMYIIDKEEQLERFEARAEDPDKQHKLTDEDWQNHKQFDAYKQAMNEMVYYTSTEETPWKIISGQDKISSCVKSEIIHL